MIANDNAIFSNQPSNASSTSNGLHTADIAFWTAAENAAASTNETASFSATDDGMVDVLKRFLCLSTHGADDSSSTATTPSSPSSVSSEASALSEWLSRAPEENKNLETSIVAPLQCAKYSTSSWLAQHNQEQRVAANSELEKFGLNVDLSMWLAATSSPKSSFTCLTTNAPKVIEWPQILNADAFKTWLLKSREQAIDLDLASWLYIPSAAKPSKSSSLGDGITTWLSQTASSMSTSSSTAMDETPMLSRSRSFETVESWLASAVDDCGDAMTEDDGSSIRIIEDEDDDDFLEVKGEDLGYWLTNLS